MDRIPVGENETAVKAHSYALASVVAALIYSIALILATAACIWAISRVERLKSIM